MKLALGGHNGGHRLRSLFRTQSQSHSLLSHSNRELQESLLETRTDKEVHSGLGSRCPSDTHWMSEMVKVREDSTEHPSSSFRGGPVTLETGSARTDEFLSRNKQEHFFFF